MVKKEKATIQNFYDKIDKEDKMTSHNPNFETHHISVPFRMLVVGSSGAGKTNTVLNILKAMNGTFEDLLLITRNSDEPLYRFLKKKLKDAITVCENLSEVPDLDGFDKSKQHCIIIDDMVLESAKAQKPLCELFIRCRKLNISVFYLTQSYYLTPKVIRQNVNYIIFKKVANRRDIDRFMNEYNFGGMHKEALFDIYRSCTQERLDFLMIDIDHNALFHNFDRIEL